VDERTGRQTDMTKLLGAFGEYSNVPESHERPAIMKSFCWVNKSPSAHYLLWHIRLVFVINWSSPVYRYQALNIAHHHLSFMEFGHLLTRSGLTYPEVSSKVYHASFCQLGNSISLPWVIYFEAF